jgi:hypothetical protein
MEERAAKRVVEGSGHSGTNCRLGPFISIAIDEPSLQSNAAINLHPPSRWFAPQLQMLLRTHLLMSWRRWRVLPAKAWDVRLGKRR